jgi:Transglycosylase SLT domain
MAWSPDDIKRLIEVEAQLQGVDPRLALAVAQQESGLDPHNPGDSGAARGVFHLQKKAAIDAGIDPAMRDDPAMGIFGGVKYLKQQLDKSGGHIPSALSRYNRGTPDYRGIGDPDYVYHVMRHFPGGHPLGEAPADQAAYRARLNKTFGTGTAPEEPRQPPGLLARVSRAIGPASAEAATPQAPGRSRLEEIEAELARRETPRPPTAAPAPPTARSTPEQDAAYRASRGQQGPAPVSQTTPTPQTPPGASQGPPAPSAHLERFLALPSIRQLTPEDRAQKQRLFTALDPAMQAEFLRSEEPPSDLTVDIEKTSPTTPVVPRDPEARAAQIRTEREAWEAEHGRPWSPTSAGVLQSAGNLLAGRGWSEGDPLMPTQRAGMAGATREAPLEEGWTKPSTLIPLIMGLGMPGLTIGAPGAAAVERLVGKAGPLITRGARAVGEGLSQTLGWTAGRTAETGEVPSPGAIGKEAGLNIATGGVVEIPAALRAAKNAMLRRTQGAQTLLNQRAVQEAEGLGTRVFTAEDKAVVGKAFDTVAASGEQLDITPVRDLWTSLTPAEQRVAGNELKKISTTFTNALQQGKLTQWDIGELQHLRSELRKASLSKRTPETQDLLQSLRGSVDDAIANGMAKGSLPAAELLQAQKAYRKVMQAEDLQGLVTRHTKDSPNLQWQELNLAALNKDLRGGGRKSAQRLVQGMDATERQLLTQELDSLKRNYPFVRITPTVANLTNAGSLLGAGGMALAGNLPGAGAALLPIIFTAATRSPTIMSLFKRSILEGKGRLAGHHVDALINAIRHENEGEMPTAATP